MALTQSLSSCLSYSFLQSVLLKCNTKKQRGGHICQEASSIRSWLLASLAYFIKNTYRVHHPKVRSLQGQNSTLVFPVLGNDLLRRCLTDNVSYSLQVSTIDNHQHCQRYTNLG